MRQAAEDLFLFQAVGHRHLHGAIERQFVILDPLEDRHCLLNYQVALEQLAAELGPRDLDLLGQRDFRCRVSSGISPIWVRYIRTGSSDQDQSLPSPGFLRIGYRLIDLDGGFVLAVDQVVVEIHLLGLVGQLDNFSGETVRSSSSSNNASYNAQLLSVTN